MGASSSIRSKEERNKVTAQDKAILKKTFAAQKVKLLRDTVKVYLRNVEHSLQYEQDLALQLIQKGRRERAKCILRKQLVLLEHLRSTDKQLEALEESIISLESSALQAKIFEGLRTGNLALKRANEVLNIKNVELILEETVQAIEKQEEINKMVNVLGMAKSEEVWDLERELDNLQEKSHPSVAVVVSAGSKSSKEPSSSSKDDAIPEEKPSKEKNARSLKTKFKKKLKPAEIPETEPSTSSKTKGKNKKSTKKNTPSGTNIPSAKKEVGISINDE